MIRLIVLRHAPTEWNRERKIQGRRDVPLDAHGRDRAASWRIPAEWSGLPCVASPLQRALETARLLGFEPRPEPALIEMAWGDWEGRRLADLRAELGQEMADREAMGLELSPPGGESPAAVQCRLRPWLEGLKTSTIAVTHKGVIRALYALATGWDMRQEPAEKLRPCCAHVFRIGDGAITVDRLNISLEATP